MYYQDYEDYMKNVLGNRYIPEYMNQANGYPYNYYAPTYSMPMNIPANPVSNIPEYSQFQTERQDLDAVEVGSNLGVVQITEDTEKIAKVKKLYPEIYILLTPMVEKTVLENSEKEITEELVESMTNQVYNAIQDDMNVKQVNTNQSLTNNKNVNGNVKQVSNIQVARRPENHSLKDLIKILLINSLINNLRSNRPGQRPPHRPENRPPMPRNYNAMSYFNTPYPEDEYIG